MTLFPYTTLFRSFRVGKVRVLTSTLEVIATSCKLHLSSVMYQIRVVECCCAIQGSEGRTFQVSGETGDTDWNADDDDLLGLDLVEDQCIRSSGELISNRFQVLSEFEEDSPDGKQHSAYISSPSNSVQFGETRKGSVRSTFQSAGASASEIGRAHV